MPTPPEMGGLRLIDEPMIIPGGRRMWQPTTKDEKLEPVFLDVNADGIFEYEMTIPENVIRASVDVSHV